MFILTLMGGGGDYWGGIIIHRSSKGMYSSIAHTHPSVKQVTWGGRLNLGGGGFSGENKLRG